MLGPSGTEGYPIGYRNRYPIRYCRAIARWLGSTFPARSELHSPTRSPITTDTPKYTGTHQCRSFEGRKARNMQGLSNESWGRRFHGAFWVIRSISGESELMKYALCFVLLGLGGLVQEGVSSAAQRNEIRPVRQTTDTLLAFDGFDEMLGLDWEILNADPTHYSLKKRPGCLTITTQEGGLSQDATNYKNIFLVGCPRPPAGSGVQLTTRLLSFKPAVSWNQAGLIFYSDDDNYFKWVYECADGRIVFTAVGETAGEFRQHCHFAAPPGLETVWLRLTRRGPRYSCSVSLDGDAFLDLGDLTWDGPVPQRVGVLAKNAFGSVARELDAPFDFFEVKAVSRMPGRFEVPEANLRPPQTLDARVVGMQRIYTAIQKYTDDQGHMPQWLSDLAPKYIRLQELVCPDDPNYRPKCCPDRDPKVQCGYSYQFAPWGQTAWPAAATYRDWRSGQRETYGDLVPVIRCQYQSDPVAFLNMGLNGCVYTSGLHWETILTPNYKAKTVECEGVGLPVGSSAPQFTAVDLDGTTVPLAVDAGSTVILLFWASYSGQCAAILRQLQDIQEEHPGIRFLTVSLDRDEKRVCDFLRRERISLPVLCDGNGWEMEAVQRYRVRTVPCTYIINRDGMVIGSITARGEEDFRSALARAIR